MNGQKTLAETIKDNLHGKALSIIFFSVLVSTLSATLISEKFINIDWGDPIFSKLVNVSLIVVFSLVLAALALVFLFIIEIITIGLIQLIIDIKERIGIETIIIIILIVVIILLIVKPS